MRLIFVYGLPATGKLTVARELALITGFQVFHNHLAVDLLLSVFEFGSRPFVELREQIWLSVRRWRSNTPVHRNLDGSPTLASCLQVRCGERIQGRRITRVRTKPSTFAREDSEVTRCQRVVDFAGGVLP